MREMAKGASPRVVAQRFQRVVRIASMNYLMGDHESSPRIARRSVSLMHSILLKGSVHGRPT